MEALEKDLAIAVAGNSPLESIIARAKWKKKTDLMFEANRLFERRYGSPKGELQLVQKLFGDQLNLAPLIEASDINQRLEWYKRRAGKDYETAVRQRIAAHSVTSPIEQLFLLEWHYTHVEERLGVALVPQHKIDADGQPYVVDFFISKPGQSIKGFGPD